MDNDDELAGMWYGALIWEAGFLGLLHMSADPPDDPAWVVMGWVSATLICAVAGLYVVLTRFWRRWAFWCAPIGSRRTVPGQLAEFALIIPTLVAVFAALNTMMAVHGWIGIEGELGRQSVVTASLVDFCLVLIGSVPILDLVGSFEIAPAVSFHGVAHGVLIVTFRVLLLAPVISVASNMVDRHRDKQRTAAGRQGAAADR